MLRQAQQPKDMWQLFFLVTSTGSVNEAYRSDRKKAGRWACGCWACRSIEAYQPYIIV